MYKKVGNVGNYEWWFCEFGIWYSTETDILVHVTFFVLTCLYTQVCGPACF